MQIQHFNTPGTAGGPGGRDRTLAVKSRKITKKSAFFVKKKNYLHLFFLHISSSYAKMLGETNFRTLEIPRSESKAKDGEKERRKKTNNGNNNGQATHGTRKNAWRTQAAWAKKERKTERW